MLLYCSLSPSLCRTSWNSDGKSFAVPVGNEVHIFTKDKDAALYILKDEAIVSVGGMIFFIQLVVMICRWSKSCVHGNVHCNTLLGE